MKVTRMGAMGQEAARLTEWSERHRRLVARLGLVLLATLVVDVFATAGVYFLERGAKQTEVHTLGDAAFFTTVQLLTVSSNLRNPVTAGGRVLDVFLELWGVIVVAGSAGAVATFFQSAHDEPTAAARRMR